MISRLIAVGQVASHKLSYRHSSNGLENFQSDMINIYQPLGNTTCEL
jgi:hypothetical protein